MNLIPIRDESFGLGALQDHMNRLFNSFFVEEDPGTRKKFLWPSIDVIETPENLQVKAELPGIAPDDIEISVVGDTLTIKGEKTTEKEVEGKTWHRRERRTGRFVRSITLPTSVDAEHVEAIEKSGILTITLPKLEPTKARRITVRSS